MELDIHPPTETTTISAQRVLVLAPHSDDEIFGCGGLLAGLAADGAEIAVLYLTDSSGGSEVTSNREAYAERRRAEAQRGLGLIGISEFETLDVPDGDLESHIDTAAEAITRRVCEHRPDLLLSVSPSEITADHRAAFAALHRTLSPLRGGTELDEIVAGCRILLYEVNHPGYPNVLVDVSPRIELLKSAIDAHESQLELHNYREAALGMRSHRALSLPKSVTAAEAYREVEFVDFVVRSHHDLVRALGGIPERRQIDDGPLVSVIVRTKDRPQLLRQALDSIAESSYRRVEVVLVNDGGATPLLPASFPFPTVDIEMEVNRGRAAAANAGVDAATGDFICFLDDDDLMAAEHLETLVGLVSAAGVKVAYTDAAVGVYELDGDAGWAEAERRLPYSRDFDPDLLLVDNYIPFNTLIIERELFDEAGPFQTDLEFFEDWEFLIRLAAVVPFHHLSRVTAEYRHFRGSAHHILGEQPRGRADFLRQKATVIERHAQRLGAETVARIVDGLRAEAVTHSEATAAARRELDDARRSLAQLTDAYHRLNGERAALQGEREALQDESATHIRTIRRLEGELDEHRRAVAEMQTETARLQGEEAALRATAAEHDEHIARLYAEIARLHTHVETMEATTAWKWHRRLERLKGRS